MAMAEQYVSFQLGGDCYGTHIARVQEIKGWETVTRVPCTPNFVLGVVNLRGAIIPVIDLRVRFGLSNAPFDATTVIVVLRVPADRGEKTVGIVVDAVNDVHDIAAADVQPAPALLRHSVDEAYIEGIATVGGKLIILLNVERLVNASIAAN